MIKNPSEVDRLERKLLRSGHLDVSRNFEIMEALYREACRLGKFHANDPLEGLQTDVKIARVVNSVPKTT